uniref:BolA-like protein n=1 Tax=Schistosoma mansoni TaxID=6183 RepID=A0A5K4F8R5_SCHMA
MKDQIEQKLKSLNPLHIEIVDFSDGCGLKFDVKVVSQEFEGKSLVDRHRIVHRLLEEEMKSVHALTLKTLAPSQWSLKSS